MRRRIVIRMRELLREYVNLLAEAWWEEQYQEATAKNLMLNEPGHMVEPDVRKKAGEYLVKMGLMKGPAPKNPKGPKRKAMKV